jgi:hypothetical protein
MDVSALIHAGTARGKVVAPDTTSSVAIASVVPASSFVS